jgi:transposase InsO family protein
MEHGREPGIASSSPTRRIISGFGDTTKFTIGSSAKLYLAAIMDLHSRFIVGRAVSAVKAGMCPTDLRTRLNHRGALPAMA